MIVIQNESYEEPAAEWQFQMIMLLKKVLKKHEIDIELSKKICGHFAFDLAILQDQGEIKAENKQYRPVICFEDFSGNLLYNSDEDFQLHEYTFGNLDEAFEN